MDNFGSAGERSSHPELLDYLALRFMEDGWSLKKLIRRIVLSRAYRMSSKGVTTAGPVDPENRLLAHQHRRRLEAECLRDAMLAIGGQLECTLGGPTIKQDTDNEITYRFEDRRRSVYTPVFRNKLLELFEAFDFADPNLVVGRRNVSTVAPQALYLMNNPFVAEQARQGARRLLAVPHLDETERVDRAYRRTLGRLPTPRERAIALTFLDSCTDDKEDAWTRLYQALFACLDFRYVD